MGAKAREEQAGGWTVEGAESLLSSLKGVVSARVVTSPDQGVQEIHLLTTRDVSPKQTVRNVESALRAQLDLDVDHRKISVAQTSAQFGDGDGQTGPVVIEGVRRAEERILFVGHQVESNRARQVRFAVDVEWQDERYRGEAMGPDIPRARMEAVANAALRAVEAAARDAVPADFPPDLSLALEGAKVVDAFDRKYVLVAIRALYGRESVPLSGLAEVEDSTDKSVIVSVLQAADRWIRGRM